MKLNKILFLTISVILISSFSSAEAASSTCSRLNEIKNIKNKENTCTRVSGKLIWKNSSVGIPEIILTDLLLIPDGFSIQIAGFDPIQKWNLTVSTGEVSLNESGLVTVTGNLQPKDYLTLKLSKGKYFRSTTYSGEAFNLKTFEEPVFAPDISLTFDNVRIEILNFDSEKNWEVSSTLGDAQIDNVGVLEVSNLESAGNIEITILISADGYKTFSKTYSYTITADDNSKL